MAERLLRALILALLLGGAARGESDPQGKASLVVQATIVQREEIWDRRSNPLMGRPDILKEIRLSLDTGNSEITACISGHKPLLSLGYLDKGMSGTFYLSGDESRYELLAVESLLRPQNTPKPAALVQGSTPKQGELKFPENKGGQELKASKALQRKALKVISDRYRMTHGRILFLTSFSGPQPPEGGYVYWGVTGKVGGQWHVWQPGHNGVLRKGSALIDPKRHQK